jgi:hypothetical protein
MPATTQGEVEGSQRVGIRVLPESASKIVGDVHPPYRNGCHRRSNARSAACVSGIFKMGLRSVDAPADRRIAETLTVHLLRFDILRQRVWKLVVLPEAILLLR